VPADLDHRDRLANLNPHLIVTTPPGPATPRLAPARPAGSPAGTGSAQIRTSIELVEHMN
jgi:hypothetical protein